MSTKAGLRERKKQQTRRVIVGAASRLFAQRGFDSVTVAEIAAASNVSTMTVFNYFPTKEDLFFGGMEFFEERLIDAVQDRTAGVSAVAAFRQLVLDGCEGLATEERAAVIAKAATVIDGSPALQMREREIVARYAEHLADLLAAETGAEPDDVEPRSVASALMAAHRAVVRYVRHSAAAGIRGPTLAARAHSQAARAFSRLEEGLAQYAVKSGRG